MFAILKESEENEADVSLVHHWKVEINSLKMKSVWKTPVMLQGKNYQRKANKKESKKYLKN